MDNYLSLITDTDKTVGAYIYPYGLFGGGDTASSTAYTDKYTLSNNVVS